MTSQLGQLKAQLEKLSQDCRTTAGNIQAFEKAFSQSSAQVQGLIGGTATKADQEIVAVLQQASKSVEEAVSSLARAAKAARDYASQA